MCLTVRRIPKRKMRLTVRRIYDIFRAGVQCIIPYPRLYNKGGIRRRLAGPLHRIFRASPHSRGGASYAVTHSRRKYHNACMRCVARCFAIAALRRWSCSLRPPAVRPPFTGDHPCVPAAWLRAYRMYLIALFSCRIDRLRPAGARHNAHGALLPNGGFRS